MSTEYRTLAELLAERPNPFLDEGDSGLVSSDDADDDHEPTGDVEGHGYEPDGLDEERFEARAAARGWL